MVGISNLLRRSWILRSSAGFSFPFSQIISYLFVPVDVHLQMFIYFNALFQAGLERMHIRLWKLQGVFGFVVVSTGLQ